MTADGDDIPMPSRVVRYVPFGRMDKDEHDNFLRPYPNAFAQRESEDYLSVTWCEYFNGSANEQIRCSVEAIRASNINVKPKACFCVANTPEVLAAIEDRGRRGRAIYLPEDDNAAHAGIYGIAPEDALLLERLSNEVWCEYLTKATADALPMSECAKSADVE
ncbi:hypothetical protein SAMN05443999_102415 [Roseovarius azorensis]|uniref:Uncharacterized protein n=1 Tax=Roseovarius azorensis TaxID=1287727 RepID=A0A1H7KH80_9RHOB|nr:hypothetical protein [Roseovarius azorensis]SEK85884.1 hypothetical protein SAMN05443999_102415 [Roseovarius azorensis]